MNTRTENGIEDGWFEVETDVTLSVSAEDGSAKRSMATLTRAELLVNMIHQIEETETYRPPSCVYAGIATHASIDGAQPFSVVASVVKNVIGPSDARQK